LFQNRVLFTFGNHHTDHQVGDATAYRPEAEPIIP